MCHHSITFGGHRHSGSGDIIILACHMMLQDKVMRGSRSFIAAHQGEQPSLQVWWS